MDACAGCAALRREAGEHAEWLSRRLLVRGWAGRLSDAERAYLVAHADWYRAAVEKAARMREQRGRAA